MIKKLLYISSLILAALSAISCSKEDASLLTGEGTVIITGIVTDIETGAVIQDIKITFDAYSPKGRLLDTKTSYSSSDGIYSIEADGFTSMLECRLTASDEKNTYSKAEIEISVPWNGTSFNSKNGEFVINDCNFYLQKRNTE